METTDQKAPPEASLGGERCGAGALLSAGGEGDGHVPRNVRLALAAIDMVRPHVELLKGAGKKGSLGSNSRAARLEQSACVGGVQLRWRVWGAVAVDATWPVWRQGNGSWKAAGERLAGHGVWGGSVSRPGSAALKPDPTQSDDGVFSACVRLPPDVTGPVEFAAVAAVDGAWAHAPPARAAVTPPLPPQTHIVNARTNPEWRHTSQRRRVRGRTEWRSQESFEVHVLRGGKLRLPGRHLSRAATRARRRALRDASTSSSHRHTDRVRRRE